MPTIRNRRSRREPSSDRIEEGGTQDEVRGEDVEDTHDHQANEEEQPRRRGSARQNPPKKVKKESTRRTAQAPAAVEERAAGDDAGEDAGSEGAVDGDAEPNEAWLDLDNFQNQPLDSGLDGPSISGIARDWKTFIGNWDRSAMNIAPQVAEAMAEVGLGRGTEKDQALKELEKMDIKMREFVDFKGEIEAHYSVLTDMCNEVALKPTSDVVNLYNTNVEKKLEEWRKKTTRQKLIGKESPYAQFKQRVYEVQNPSEAMPPLTEFIAREEGDESDDDDLAVGGATQNYNCHLTLRPMEKPMRSKICGHTFSEEGIKAYFDGGRGRKKCPGAGCNKEQSLGDYVYNQEFAKKVKDHLRRERRQQEDREEDVDDDSEVIE